MFYPNLQLLWFCVLEAQPHPWCRARVMRLSDPVTLQNYPQERALSAKRPRLESPPVGEQAPGGVLLMGQTGAMFWDLNKHDSETRDGGGDPHTCSCTLKLMWGHLVYREKQRLSYNTRCVLKGFLRCLDYFFTSSCQNQISNKLPLLMPDLNTYLDIACQHGGRGSECLLHNHDNQSVNPCTQVTGWASWKFL